MRRALVLAGLAVAIPASAQTGFVKQGATAVFGAPSIGRPAAAPSDDPRPDLPGPTDMPDPPTGAGRAADVTADLAFGAYQRGFYATALREAMKRLGRDNRDGPAMTLAGELFAQGLGVKADKAEAARWYALAADAGDPQAMFALGMARMRGEGVTQDREAARALFTRAGAHDNAGALFYLGLMALQGDGKDPATGNPATAAGLFRHSADLGYPEAQYALGLMYRQGNGVEADDGKAAALIKAAADNDTIAAMVDYGIMVFNGVGTPKDEAAAARYFVKAAARNNPVAQDRAARLYVAGRGIAKDVVEGMKWHVLANSSGLKDAWLDDEMRKLSPQEREAVDRAVRHYVGS